MTEDVSAYVRSGVTINLLAGLVASVLVVSTTAFGWLSDFQTNYINSINNAKQVTGIEIKNEKRISAAIAYKFIASREGQLQDVTITYLDGTITTDYKTLLQNANKEVRLTYSDGEIGFINIEVEEVN